MKGVEGLLPSAYAGEQQRAYASDELYARIGKLPALATTVEQIAVGH